MILKKITINGVEYFQWTYTNYRERPFLTTVGDLFSKWRDIPMEKAKFKQQLRI